MDEVLKDNTVHHALLGINIRATAHRHLRAPKIRCKDFIFRRLHAEGTID